MVVPTARYWLLNSQVYDRTSSHHGLAFTGLVMIGFGRGIGCVPDIGFERVWIEPLFLLVFHRILVTSIYRLNGHIETVMP